MTTQLLGFTPSLDPTTPGVLLDVINMVPTVKGMRGADYGLACGLPPLAAACNGAALIYHIDGTNRLFAGTTAKLYESNAGITWTDRSRVAAYTSGVDIRWRFTQFGDVTVAANGTDVLQASTTAAFADIATAPKARYLETVAGFVMALAYNDGVNNFPDGWFCSGLFDYTNWTPSVSSQSANGRLLDTNGEIRGGRKLGSLMVVYKQDSMYIGAYQGPPVIWSWQLISNSIGAYSHEAIIPVDNFHLFLGPTGFYIFDGTKPNPIGDAEVREWFFANSNQAYLYKTLGGYDTERKLAYWCYPSSLSTGTLDSVIVYHIPSGKFGKVTRNVEALVYFATASLTYDGLGAIYSTYNDLPADTNYDNPAWLGGIAQAGYFDIDHRLYVARGTPRATSSLVTGDWGDDSQFSTITRVRPRFIKSPTSANLTHYTKNVEGDALATGATATYDDGKFDLLESCRWHRVKLDFSGDFEISGIDIELSPDGIQ